MLREIIERHLVSHLVPATVDHLGGGFDLDRRADTRPADRRLAYGLAWAAHGELNTVPLHRSKAAWQAVIQLFDTLCDLQTKDGNWEWYVPNQQKTFSNLYPFAMVSLLRTRFDFGTHFEPLQRHRIDAMFHRALEGHVKTARAFLDSRKRNVGLNILTALMSALYVGGAGLQESQWRDLATQVIHVICSMQSPAGFWPDDGTHHGPATLYNTVTLTHLAEYALASNDPTAIDSIARSAAFHRAFVYPDGSPIETIDERNRYHHGTIPALLTAYAVFDKTRPAAAEYAALLGENGIAGFSPQEMDLYGTLPDALWVDAWRHTPANFAAVHKPASYVHDFPAIPAVVRRDTPWMICVSGCLRSGPARRYHYDLQNHLSIWHDRCGLIVGGGNSLHDPYFSTFRFRERYLASSATVDAGQNVSANFLYGQADAHFQVRVINKDHLEITAEAKGDVPTDSTFVLHLPQKPGARFDQGGAERTLSREAIHLEVGSPVTIGQVRLTCDGPLMLNWPCLPIDIYDPPKRDEAHPVFHVAANLSKGPIRIRLQVV